MNSLLGIVCRRVPSGYDVVRITLGAILLLAAGSKPTSWRPSRLSGLVCLIPAGS